MDEIKEIFPREKMREISEKGRQMRMLLIQLMNIIMKLVNFY